MKKIKLVVMFALTLIVSTLLFAKFRHDPDIQTTNQLPAITQKEAIVDNTKVQVKLPEVVNVPEVVKAPSVVKEITINLSTKRTEVPDVQEDGSFTTIIDGDHEAAILRVNDWYAKSQGTHAQLPESSISNNTNLTSNDFRELGPDNPNIKSLITAHTAMSHEIMGMSNVIGTAVGHDDTGTPGIVIYVNKNAKDLDLSTIPNTLHGEKIIVVPMEPFHAFTANIPPVSHTAKQTIPIQLGTSGSWSYDLANGYCCGGTLGSLISINGIQYIMSNYHVFESDIIPGGNKRVSTTGDPIVQPGLVDDSCSLVAGTPVATLNKLSSLPKSNVDVSIAKVKPGMVNPTGAILEIGTINKLTTLPYLKQAVKKSGRTSSLTHSKISGLNAMIMVMYENECAGNIAFIKVFTGQILIDNPSSSFLASGDSGSLKDEDGAYNQRAIGLLFAGSTTVAIANPITEVLNYIWKTTGGLPTMVGN